MMKVEFFLVAYYSAISELQVEEVHFFYAVRRKDVLMTKHLRIEYYTFRLLPLT
jgi:hypothetical protein